MTSNDGKALCGEKFPKKCERLIDLKKPGSARVDNNLIYYDIFLCPGFLIPICHPEKDVLEKVCVISRKHGLFLEGCYNR
jgi:hypothetical protein